MTKDDFLVELAVVLDEEQLDENRKMKTIDMFDSTGMMSVIAMISAKLQHRINVDSMRQCETVGDLLTLVKEKLI